VFRLFVEKENITPYKPVGPEYADFSSYVCKSSVVGSL